MSEFILIFIAILLLFSFFRRYIFYFILKAVSKKLSDQMQRQQGKTARQSPEGSITIDTSKAVPKKKDDNDEGEYVSYEEIK